MQHILKLRNEGLDRLRKRKEERKKMESKLINNP